ncbi:MAG: methyltransferase [Oscillospiraceae bacterium]|nr:methyltransferase [Oscillospiraceae bacterium]MCL2278412.1 methyltransferase [Oscillospiraceae bacterium]
MADELWHGGPRFVNAKGVYRIGTDSVLLAYFANNSGVKKKTLAADLGCGSGVLSILLATFNPGLTVDAVELSPDATECARKSAELSGMSDRINVIESDIRKHREFLRSGAYDLVVTNPPYYASGTGALSYDPNRAAARSETSCSLDNIMEAAGYLTRWGGSFSLVHKPERLCDIFRAMNKHGIEPKRMRLVQNKADSPPSLILVEGRRGGKPSLKIEAPLILKNNDDTDSDEVNRIYHR